MYIVRCLMVSSFITYSVWASELSYDLQSPLVGGTNSALYQSENSRNSMVNQKAAKQEAEEQKRLTAEKQALTNSPEARFASALQSQLFMTISQQLSQRITSIPEGQSGTFQSGDVLVSYTNQGSYVSVMIATPGGTSTLELPTGQ